MYRGRAPVHRTMGLSKNSGTVPQNLGMLGGMIPAIYKHTHPLSFLTFKMATSKPETINGVFICLVARFLVMQ